MKKYNPLTNKTLKNNNNCGEKVPGTLCSSSFLKFITLASQTGEGVLTPGRRA